MKNVFILQIRLVFEYIILIMFLIPCVPFRKITSEIDYEREYFILNTE